MIRRAFNVDPYSLSEDKFSLLAQEALWLSKYDQDVMEEAIWKAALKIFKR